MVYDDTSFLFILVLISDYSLSCISLRSKSKSWMKNPMLGRIKGLLDCIKAITSTKRGVLLPGIP